MDTRPTNSTRASFTSSGVARVAVGLVEGVRHAPRRGRRHLP